ncbi:hypothetical protein ACJ73_06137 [Blastomyces percursus]|uniref:Uncharacterized protein n=1 Tax=Blastomyces percursus TaxID=1658174 RepID=A0A1J9Q1V5_9EURO|nr:hypothetical protein ACJ73_06137 [Blastomyces percursus]
MPVTLDGNEDIDLSDKNLEQQLREAFVEFENKCLLGHLGRLSSLRVACLVRDHRCCVISRKFDFKEAATRIQKNSYGARDDRAFLKDDPQVFETLEVAHTQSREAAITILNMFDSGFAHVIEGHGMEQLFNAISLTPTLQNLFEGFQIFFEPVSTQLPHVYTIG